MIDVFWKLADSAPMGIVTTATGVLTALDWLLAVWMLLVGGCFGSLMNVIIYRWPAGMSIVYPNSRCPFCEHPIRWFDNLPVFGWLVLRGRCRDCGVPIAARYPLVEACVAVVFLSLVFIEVFSEGANLPSGGQPFSPPTVWIAYGLHVLLLCTLICAALIHYDGKRAPLKLFAFPILAGLIVPLVWPRVRPLPVGVLDVSGWTSVIAEGLAGMIVGALSGYIGSLACAGNHDRSRPGTVLPLMLCGVVLGWQATALLASVVAAMYFLSAVECRLRRGVRQIPWSAFLTIAVMLLLIYWRLLDEHAPQLTRDANAATFAVLALITFALSAANGLIGAEHANSR